MCQARVLVIWSNNSLCSTICLHSIPTSMLDPYHPMLPLFGSTLLFDKPAWTRCWSFLAVWFIFIPCEPDSAKPGRMTEPPALPWEGDKQEASPSHTSGSREIFRASDLCSDPNPFLHSFNLVRLTVCIKLKYR